jgi:hypothetical protein
MTTYTGSTIRWKAELGDYNTQLADQKTNYESLMGQYSDLTGQ